MKRGGLKKYLHAPGIVVTPPPTPVASYAINPAEIIQTEGNSGTLIYRFYVDRTVVTTGTGSVDFTITGAGSNPADASDFAAMTGTVTFANGDTHNALDVLVNGDTTLEPDERFNVTISNPLPAGSVITTATAQGVILNNDSGVTTAQPITLPTNPQALVQYNATVAATGWSDGVYDIGNGLSMTVTSEVGQVAGVPY